MEDCLNDAAEWSWIHDLDPHNVNNYRSLCHSHHVRYDGRDWHGVDQRCNIDCICNRHRNHGGRGSTKLKAEDILEIRDKWDAGIWNQKDIMTIYNLKSSGYVSNIIARRVWKHI
jgi:hypothetical protein